MTDVQDKTIPHTMPICGDDYPLTDKQQKLMALARQLGREKFAPRAAQLDREAQFPFGRCRCEVSRPAAPPDGLGAPALGRVPRPRLCSLVCAAARTFAGCRIRVSRRHLPRDV